jgi:hypothetical protein
MRYTQADLALGRKELFVRGVMRPAVIAIPSALLFRRWWQPEVPAIDVQLYAGWVISTLLLAWFIGMSKEDRALLSHLVSRVRK